MKKNISDEWGGIDEQIQNLVTALNALKISTTGSCAGHVDHGAPAPWVKITPTITKNLDAVTTTKRLLLEFYKNRIVPADVRISIEKANVGFWIHNGGKAYTAWRKAVNQRAAQREKSVTKKEYIALREQQKRAKTLPEYQKEISLFAKFLKKKSN
jgi:hypothetical protein